jgi:hypothetical protein
MAYQPQVSVQQPIAYQPQLMVEQSWIGGYNFLSYQLSHNIEEVIGHRGQLYSKRH